MEQLHPFNDGNCRTFCMLLFSHLLMENGFPPPVQKNPNNFDGHSIQELLDQTIQGMTDTMDLATQRKKKQLYGVTTADILSVATPEEIAYAASLGIVSPDVPSAIASVSDAEAKIAASRYGIFQPTLSESPAAHGAPLLPAAPSSGLSPAPTPVPDPALFPALSLAPASKSSDAKSGQGTPRKV